jgi:hypothetical protein
MKRIVVCTTLSVLALALAAPPVSAAQPIFARGSTGFDIAFPAEICGFAIDAHVRTKAQTITFVDADGNPVRGLSTGQLFVTLTNADSGFSRTFAIPGPSFFDATGTLVHGTGTWLTFTAAGAFVLAAGNMDMDPTGNILAIRGRTFDVCELLG